MSKQDKEGSIRLPLILIALALIVTPLVAKALEKEATEPTIRNNILKSGGEYNLNEQIVQYIKDTFPEDPYVAVAVAKAESGLVECAYGDKNNKYAVEGSWGIFQINKAVHKELIGNRNLCNWKDNIDIARVLHEESGWQPWSAFTNGSYLKHYGN